MKNEILSNMEGLQHYVSQPTNALLETKLTKYEQRLQKCATTEITSCGR